MEKLGTPVSMRRDNITPRKEATALSVSNRPIFKRVFGCDVILYNAVRALEA